MMHPMLQNRSHSVQLLFFSVIHQAIFFHLPRDFKIVKGMKKLFIYKLRLLDDNNMMATFVNLENAIRSGEKIV